MRLNAFVTTVLVHFFQLLCAQTGEVSPREWATELSRSGDKINAGFKKIDSILTLRDSSGTFTFLKELFDHRRPGSNYFLARFNCLKARQIYLKNFAIDLNKVKPEVKGLFAEALRKAYESEDDYLIAFVSINYGGLIYHFGEMELSVMYSMNGVELNEKLFGTNNAGTYQSLGDLLYKIKEYNGSVQYSRKALDAATKETGIPESAVMSALNTIALGYHRQRIYDSAFIYYGMALQKAEKLKNDVWKGIISGNMGQIHYHLQQYDTASKLLQMDYLTSKAAGYFDNAANSLQWLAQTELARGNKKVALTQLREAIQLLKKGPDVNYQRNCFFAAANIFQELGMYDSAYYYTTLYSKLNDSLEQVVNRSSIAISKARLNDEQSRYSIQRLQQEKRSQLFQRNVLIVSIVLLALVALLLVNRQRLKSRLQMELMQKEIASAKEQLKMFTENIVEKTNLIEKLEEQIKNKNHSVEQKMIIDELSHQTILTEEDWLKFKSLFEKIYPGFFIKLKEVSSDITLAEQRMAALSRLQLTNSQMAAMLGISADSVRKNRMRLKQRLGLSAESNLEEIINTL